MNSQSSWHFLSLLDQHRLPFSAFIFRQQVLEHTKFFSAGRLCTCLSICPNVFPSWRRCLPEWRLEKADPSPQTSPFSVCLLSFRKFSMACSNSFPCVFPLLNWSSTGTRPCSLPSCLALGRMTGPQKLIHKYL